MTCTLSGGYGYSGDGGQATAASLATPKGIALDTSGNIYIADCYNHCIRKVNSSGIISTIAGTGTAGFSGDGGQATLAQFHYPYGIALDVAGNIYVADYSNYRIRKISTSGIITTIAGIGTGSGALGDGGQATAARLFSPCDITIDAAGNLYIADAGNNRIRKINTSGIITTVAGNGGNGFSGDGGQASVAELYGPSGITLDAIGNLYIEDGGNYRIRKVNTSGIITTIAGNGTWAYSGDGGQATAAGLNPWGVTCNPSGNIYITDYGNNRIRMVDTSGIVSTVAGNGTQGFSGDGGLATAAELTGPNKVVFDASGNAYFTEEGNNCVRAICMGSSGRNSRSTNGNLACNNNSVKEISDEKNILIYPNPTSDQFYIETNATDKLTVDLCDVNGRHVFSKSANDKSNIDVTSLNEGIYSLTIKTADHVINKKLVILR